MQTSLVQLRRGDNVIYEPTGRKIPMKITDYQLAPQGINKPGLCCIITAVSKDGMSAMATTDKFQSIDNESYRSVYESYISK